MKHFIDTTYQTSPRNKSDYSDLPLFCSPDICKTKHRGAKNSKRAFNKVEASIPSRKKQIVEIIRARGNATLKEVADILGVQRNTISGRFTQLVVAGLIRKTGESRDGFAVYEVVV